MAFTLKTENQGKMGSVVYLTSSPNNWLQWLRWLKQEAAERCLSDNAKVLEGNGEYNLPPRTAAELQELLGIEVTPAVLAKFAVDIRMADIKAVVEVGRKNSAFTTHPPGPNKRC